MDKAHIQHFCLCYNKSVYDIQDVERKQNIEELLWIMKI